MQLQKSLIKMSPSSEVSWLSEKRRLARFHLECEQPGTTIHNISCEIRVHSHFNKVLVGCAADRLQQKSKA